MKTYWLPVLLLAALFIAGCGRGKTEQDAMHGVPKHETSTESVSRDIGKLDIDGMLAELPEGWSMTEPSSSMRSAQVSIAPAEGDTLPGEIAFFFFPGSGGSARANIMRWQSQFAGPNGEPGSETAKTDTMMAGLLKVTTTDITGTQLASGMGMGPAEDMKNFRMIASVVETPSGNWFIKAVGPQQTITNHEANIRALLKRSRVITN